MIHDHVDFIHDQSFLAPAKESLTQVTVAALERFALRHGGSKLLGLGVVVVDV